MKKWFCFLARSDSDFNVAKQVTEFLNKNPSLGPEDTNIIIVDTPQVIKAFVFYRAEEKLH